MSAHRTSRRIIVYGFLLVITVLVAITGTGLYRIQQLSSGLTAVVKERDVQIALMHTMGQAARDRSITLQSMMISKDPFTIDEFALEMSNASAHYLVSREELLQHKLTGEERQLLEQQHQQSVKTGSSQNRIIEYLRNGNYAPAEDLLFYTTLPGQRRAMGMMDEFISLKRRQNLNSLESTSQAIENTYGLMLLLSALGVIFSTTVAMLIHRRISSEIARREQTENNLRHSELRERTIRENIIDGLLTLDARGNILSCNKACKAIFGYGHGAMIGKNASTLMPQVLSGSGGDITRHLEVWEKRMIGMGREVMGTRCDGQTFPAELDLSKIELDGEPIYIAVVRDISEKKEAEQRLQRFNQELEKRVVERTEELAQTNDKLRHEIHERIKAQEELTHQATHDPLTDLPNRALFNEHLAIMLNSAKKQQRSLALLFLDLDGFKAVNDTFGHDAGDQLLQFVSHRLRNCLRQEEILARMGGDEFTILLSDGQQPNDAVLVAKKIITELNQPFPVNGHHCHVGVSIGISCYPGVGSDADTLLRVADDAMYRAKAKGKNTYDVRTSESTAESEPLLAPSST